MTQNKLGKLRSKLKETEKKKEQLNKQIVKLNKEILEEETKGFRNTLTELGLSYEEAMEFLTSKNRPTVKEIHDSIGQQDRASNLINSYEKEQENHV